MSEHQFPIYVLVKWEPQQYFLLSLTFLVSPGAQILDLDIIL